MICTISKHAAEAKGYADAMMLDDRGKVTEAAELPDFSDCFLTGSATEMIPDSEMTTSKRPIRPRRSPPNKIRHAIGPATA